MNKKNILIAITSLLLVTIIILTNVTKTQGANAKLHEYKYYISVEIQHGDTLWSIAENYMTAEYSDIDEYIEEVKSINNLGTDNIHAGNYIVVPYYTNEKQ